MKIEKLSSIRIQIPIILFVFIVVLAVMLYFAEVDELTQLVVACTGLILVFIWTVSIQIAYLWGRVEENDG